MVAIKSMSKESAKSKKTAKDKGGSDKGTDLDKQSWRRVKIKGKVIADDGVGFEGLIGLEVLQNYDPVLVNTAKEKRKYRDRKQNVKAKRSKIIKLEQSTEDVDIDDIVSATESESETDQEEEQLEEKQKSRKQKLADRAAQKLQKRKEKRDRRKQTKKGEKNVSEAKVKGKPQKNVKDRFALVRPPTNDSDKSEAEDEVPELVATTADISNLQGWNGLGVPTEILRAIAERGFMSPTEIQTLTLPPAIFGKKDILGAAETGSGKTLAFGIPILTGIMELKSKNAATGIRKVPKDKKLETAEEKIRTTDHELTPPPEELADFSETSSESEDDDDDNDGESMKSNIKRPLYALVLTPTRELAVQVRDHIVAAAKYTGIRVAAIFGGLSVAKQERLLRRCPEIVVATPGRLWELYQQENPHLIKIDDISFLVIDETDRMVEKGHFEELRSLLKVLNSCEEKKRSRQNFVFSATLTLIHDLPDYLRKRNKGKNPKFFKQTPGLKLQSLIDELGISQPKIVDITRSQQTAQNLTECRLICPIDQKDHYLYYFLQRHLGRTIVFCNSIDCVKRLTTLFGLLDCHPLPLHANMMQKQRLKNLERFRDNPNGLLIATDVAARGLDIPNVEHVIHYQVPRTSENYVHRSGRTARANKDGLTVIFMEPGEVKNYVKLYRTLDRSEDLPIFPIVERYLAAVRERVNLAREVDKQELKVRRVQSEAGWMKKHADEMDMIIEGYNDDSGSDHDEDPFIIEKRRNRIQLEATRAKLKSLLSVPIFPKGFSFKYPTTMNTIEQTGTDVDKSNGVGPINAVKLVKDSIEDMKLMKKMRNKKRKFPLNP